MNEESKGVPMSDQNIEKVSLFFKTYKSWIKYTLPIFVVIVVLVLRSSVSKGRSETDFLTARTSFNKWVKEPHVDNIYYRNLRAAMKKHPELKSLYLNPMLQHLIASGEKKHSKRLMDKLCSELENSLCYYDRFARNSLLMTLGKYKEALDGTLRLKDDLMHDADFWEKSKDLYGSNLMAFNLFRTAMLYQKMGLTAEEFVAWKEFKRAIGMEPAQSDDKKFLLTQEAIENIQRHFKAQNMSLGEYISSRERVI